MPAAQAMPSAGLLAWVRRHPDLVLVLLLLIIGGSMRMAFAFRAPPLFVGGDSQTYLVPGYELAHGYGFAPILKRPPLYPLFVAVSMLLLGEDPHGLAFFQHLLGLGTVVLTYWLGRAAFSSAGALAGRVAGLAAGLLVALNGALITYERYVMAETLFTLLLTAAALALVLGMQRASWQLYALSGALFALASMNRAAAQLLLPLVPMVALLHHRRLLPAVRLSAALAAGFLAISLPWMTATWVQTGSFGASGLGEALFWRGSREQPMLISREIGRPSDVADPTLTQARRVAYNRVFENELPSDIAVVLQQRFGYTEAQADRVLRDVAIELFARQPDRYVQTSLALFGELLVGTEQFLGGQGKSGGVTRFPNAQDKYDFWNERIRHLAQPATTAQANEFRAAQRVANVFQPFRYAPLLLGLLALGLVGATLVRGWRVAWVPVLLGLWLLLTTAFLSGALPRYRYPADPLLAVGIGGGVAVGVVGARRLLASRSSQSTSAPAPSPASTSANPVVGR
ncbi:MAG: glycosyltransferase family 39 protein [Chloroflexi bacterium]|nr:glycosyltransferase family 39 protein [Chloroflexota bacterium]